MNKMENLKRMPIELVTQKDVTEFINIASDCPTEVYIEDGSGNLRISGKSILGVKMASIEWKDLYAVYSDDLIATKLMRFGRNS